MTKEERIELYREFMKDIKTTGADIVNLDIMGFFAAPASTKYHGAYEGGLFDHSYAVAEKLVEITEKMGLKWQRPESPRIVGMWHDLCKVDLYMRNSDGTWAYNQQTPLAGHGDKSVILASRLHNLTVEEILCIRYHMGAYEGEKVWKNIGAAIETYENVLWTHTADMYVSKVMGL